VDEKIITYDPEIIGEISKSIMEGIYKYLSKNELRWKCE
jgi:hypothetical protein